MCTNRLISSFLFAQLPVQFASNQVARDAVLRFRPQINITPFHANVKDSEFNVDFFKQFNVVLNGLDNLDARRHVNRLCLAAEVPLVESGTTGFLGQVCFFSFYVCIILAFIISLGKLFNRANCFFWIFQLALLFYILC